MADRHSCSLRGDDFLLCAEDEEEKEEEEEEEDDEEEEEEESCVANVTPLDAMPVTSSLSQSHSPPFRPCHATPTNTLEGIDDFLKRSWIVIPHSLSQ